VRVRPCDRRGVPSPTVSSAGHREEGTASVELVAAVPFLLLAVLVAAQLALAGQALWSAAVAARAGARAELVGGDATAAARRALPRSLRPDARVSEAGVTTTVRVAIPRLLPALPRLMVGSESGLGDG
jgi:Flp pilus assembly protein TadG